MKLQGKVAIVTGGGTGIGKATAIRFAKEGAVVAVSGRRQKLLEETVHEIKKEGGNALALVGDVSRGQDVERWVSKTVARFGEIAILVNNAGITRGIPIMEMSEEEYDSILDINLKGAFLMTKHVVPSMIKRDGGSIINIASVLGLTAIKGWPSNAYSASKGSLIALTKALAVELAPQQIRVNAICPAVVETPIYETIFPKEQVQEQLGQLVGLHPLGRNGRPEEIAGAVLYLASDEASWMTGSILTFDGGMTVAASGWTPPGR